MPRRNSHKKTTSREKINKILRHEIKLEKKHITWTVGYCWPPTFVPHNKFCLNLMNPWTITSTVVFRSSLFWRTTRVWPRAVTVTGVNRGGQLSLGLCDLIIGHQVGATCCPNTQEFSILGDYSLSVKELKNTSSTERLLGLDRR